MLKTFSPLYFILAFGLFTSCSVYQSSDRKQFEADTASVKISQLTFSNCSENTIANRASASRLVQILNSDENNESIFLWEHKVGDITVFETDNLQGVYCIYEKL